MKKKWKSRFLDIFIALFGVLLGLTNGEKYMKSDVVVDFLEVGTLKNYTLNDETEFIIEIMHLPEKIERTPPRIFVKCEECTQENPLLLVVRQSKGVLSWELPVVIESNKKDTVYKKTERTLCPYDIKNITDLEYEYMNDGKIFTLGKSPVTLSLSTSSVMNVTAQLIVNLQTNFVITGNSNQTVYITPSSPFLFLYEFPEHIKSVLLHVTSEDDTCLIVSVQNVSCPVFDLEQNIQYRGHFQTITRQGGLTLTKEGFPNGFYIVLIVSGEDNYCYSQLLNAQEERSKRVTVSISETISSSEYKVAVLFTLLMMLIFCLIMFLVEYRYYKREKNAVPELVGPDEEEVVASASQSTLQNNISKRNRLLDPLPSESCAETISIVTDSSLDDTEFDLVSDAEFDKNIFRMKGYLYVCDLARKNQMVLKKNSEVYLWNLLTVAIFYFLPVIQLVVTNQYQLNQSGKEDLCYYNFLCSHPLWFFSDFNHVFSNIGYLILGTLFIILTVFKERLYNIKICSDKKLYKNYGIPQHFGLFYAMGAALITEGVMSACYHICPNHYNFQFDTSFMYVICTLCMIKIYQTRHPDINAASYATFFLLAGVIFIGMCGVFSENLIFRILFTILHLVTCYYISVKIYYMGRWKLTNLCNWVLAAGSFWYMHNFSSYLLTIFMVNLMIYTTFYIIMKFICKERVLPHSLVYILLSILAWSSALYFFFSKTTSWRLTPAESKLYNQPCQLLQFYDNHDIWHFISATAMFFSFKVLLTLDDDLTYVHRSKILVF
ncbi:hypothetical protein RUM44_001954 [Polyplax serrata]|uniref:SID1 transmembrane family member 1 n=1 Tax=Polyplax serrata TaxID=468196 RepID=A0ABR1AM73_POLSC